MDKKEADQGQAKEPDNRSGQSQGPSVAIIMGSSSDLPTMSAAADTLRQFQVPFEITIVSAHRTPKRMFDYGRQARERGLRVIIAGAGGAAHLPGMMAALTPLPVIGVPIPSALPGGWDSILSILQMPGGVPVATVALGQARNAALLAIRILANGQEELFDRLQEFSRKEEERVLKQAHDLLLESASEK